MQTRTTQTVRTIALTSVKHGLLYRCQEIEVSILVDENVAHLEIDASPKVLRGR